MGFLPQGPGTKMASLLAFGTIMSKVVLNHKLASSQLESLPRDGDQRPPDVGKGGEAIYLY